MNYEETLEAIEVIKNNVDIVDYIGKFVELKQRNGAFIGKCPFHNDKTPSFFVDGNSKKFICFGCGATGDVVDFIERYHHVEIDEAIKISGCSNISMIETPKIVRYGKRFKTEKKCELCNETLIDNCMDEFPESHKIQEWIDEGISEEVLTRYNVRYSHTKEKILFPIWDSNGKIITIKFRDLNWEKGCKFPKYGMLYKTNGKRWLYNFSHAKECISGLSECIVVESEKSCMKLETWGIRNSVSVGCHALSKEQIDILVKTPFNRIVFAYDQDVKKKEIIAQTNILKHYKTIYYIPTDTLEEKQAPVDNGFEEWSRLYNSKIGMWI